MLRPHYTAANTLLQFYYALQSGKYAGAGKCQTVIFRLARVGTRSHNNRNRCSAKYACRLGFGKQRYRLIEHIARLYVGEYKHVSIAHNRRCYTLNAAAVGIAGCLYIHRTAHTHIAIFTGFGTFLQFFVAHGVRKLLVYLLCAVDKCHAWTLNTYMAAYTNRITQYGVKLVKSGTRNDSRIREHYKFTIGRYLGYRYMAQYSAGLKQSVLFVEYGAQKVICVQRAFHQHCRLSFPDKSNSLAGRVIRSRLFKHLNMTFVKRAKTLKLRLTRTGTNQQKVGNSFF